MIKCPRCGAELWRYVPVMITYPTSLTKGAAITKSLIRHKDTTILWADWNKHELICPKCGMSNSHPNRPDIERCDSCGDLLKDCVCGNTDSDHYMYYKQDMEAMNESA